MTREGHLIAVRPKDGVFYDEVYHPMEGVEDEAGIDRCLDLAGEDGGSQYLKLPQISDFEMQYLPREGRKKYMKRPISPSPARPASACLNGDSRTGDMKII